LVGVRRAQEMLLTNRRVEAGEAERIGLVTRVVDDESLAAEGAKLASTLSQSATRALGATRSLILEGLDSSFEAQLAREARTIAAAGKRGESVEGICALVSKRPPNFSGA
jgi:2-(1,2-epoxy-1,2-dihydrophenyl)acetyl-CoA isomerase